MIAFKLWRMTEPRSATTAGAAVLVIDRGGHCGAFVGLVLLVGARIPRLSRIDR